MFILRGGIPNSKKLEKRILVRIFEQKGREKENREIEKIVETELTKELSSGAQKAIAK